MFLKTQDSEIINLDNVLSIYTDTSGDVYKIVAYMIGGQDVVIGKYVNLDQLTDAQQGIEMFLNENAVIAAMS